jgi:hypothetical protein
MGGAGSGEKAGRHRRLLERRGQASWSLDTLRQARLRQPVPLSRAMHGVSSSFCSGSAALCTPSLSTASAGSGEMMEGSPGSGSAPLRARLPLAGGGASLRPSSFAMAPRGLLLLPVFVPFSWGTEKFAKWWRLWSPL